MGFFRKIKENNEKGITLTEVMMGVAIIGVSTIITAQQNGQLTENYMRTKAIFSYQAVASEIVGIASQYNLAEYSFKRSTNNAIKNCITLSAAVNCQDRTGQPGYPVNLYTPDTSTLVAGTQNNPVKYDTNGEVCTNNCSFQAYTSVSPRCYQGTNCKVAHTMMLTYTVEPIANSPHWISEQLAPKPIVFETALETNLVPIVNEIPSISCNLSGRDVLKGITLNLNPLCTPFPDAVKGAKGQTGPRGPQGPNGANGRNQC